MPFRVDRPPERFHPLRPRSGRHWEPPRRLHHLVDHPPKQEGVGPLEILDRVTMQLWDDRPMIAAAVQRDIDGTTKRSHSLDVPPTALRRNHAFLRTHSPASIRRTIRTKGTATPLPNVMTTRSTAMNPSALYTGSPGKVAISSKLRKPAADAARSQVW